MTTAMIEVLLLIAECLFNIDFKVITRLAAFLLNQRNKSDIFHFPLLAFFVANTYYLSIAFLIKTASQ